MLDGHDTICSMNACLILCLACAAMLLGGCQTPGSVGQPEVTFLIPIDRTVFSKQATLQVILLDAEQIKSSEKMAGCTVSFDAATQQETVTCPEGVVYRPLEVESFTFPMQNVVSSISITSQRVQVHKPYLLRVSGLSNDNCNRVSFQFYGVADSAQIIFEEGDMLWLKTEMACPTVVP